MIRFEKVSKVFSTTAGEIHALSEIDLDIEKGCIFGIIGSSGAGKSTLVRCMNLLERPTSGDVYFDDVNLTKLPIEELRQMRRKISMIFQQFNLLEQRDALGNVCYPLEISGVPKKEAKEKALRDIVYAVKKNSYEYYSSRMGTDVSALQQVLEGKRALEELQKVHILLS